MARGNDAEAAERELKEQYGGAPNAEEMIRTHRASQDPRMHRASLSPIDQGATNALDLSGLKVGKGERVMSASVRGGYVIAVVEDERGNYMKRLMDLPKAAKEKSTIQVPVEGPKQRVSEPDPVDDGKPKQAGEPDKGEADKGEPGKGEVPPQQQPRSNPQAAK